MLYESQRLLFYGFLVIVFNRNKMVLMARSNRRLSKNKKKAVKAKSEFKRKPKLGSALIVISGFIAIAASIILGYIAFSSAPYLSLADMGFGIIIGVAILASGANSYTLKRENSEKWGVIALVLYIVEIPSFWGFGAGFLIALAGTIILLRHGR